MTNKLSRCNFKARSTKENKGKEYEPGTLQTYRNGFRRYFLERPCPPAVHNFDLRPENLQPLSSKKFQRCYPLRKRIWSKNVLTTNQMPLNQLKQKMLKRVQSAFKIITLFSIWYGGTMSHKGIRGFKDQHGCQLSDFTVTEQYIDAKSGKPRTAMETNRLEQNGRELTTRFGGRWWKTRSAQSIYRERFRNWWPSRFLKHNF